MGWRETGWTVATFIGLVACSGEGNDGADGGGPSVTGTGGLTGQNTGGAEGSGAAGVGTGGATTGGVGSDVGGSSTGGSAGGNPDYPQCFAGDAMPPNPGLTIDPDVTGVETVLSNDNYVAMLLGPDRPECITDELAYSRLQDLEDGLRDVVELVGFPKFPE